MRTRYLSLLLTLAACGGTRPAATSYPTLTDETEPIGSDASEEEDPATAACLRDADGATIQPSGDPAGQFIEQVQILEQKYPNSPSVDRAIVKLMSNVLDGLDATRCVRQYCRWYRALAQQRLKLWDGFSVDLEFIIKDGPAHPFYQDARVLKETVTPQTQEAAPASDMTTAP